MRYCCWKEDALVVVFQAEDDAAGGGVFQQGSFDLIGEVTPFLRPRFHVFVSLLYRSYWNIIYHCFKVGRTVGFVLQICFSQGRVLFYLKTHHNLVMRYLNID